jgi:hypothetical protein
VKCTACPEVEGGCPCDCDISECSCTDDDVDGGCECAAILPTATSAEDSIGGPAPELGELQRKILGGPVDTDEYADPT